MTAWLKFIYPRSTSNFIICCKGVFDRRSQPTMLVHRSIPSSRPTGHAQPLPQRTRPPPAARQHPCHRTGLTRPPFATYDGCSTPTPPSNRPAYTGNGTSSGTDTGSRHDCIQLVFRGVKPRSMTAFAGTLSVASPVLNELLKVPLDKPGVLELPNEDPEQWATVLRVVQPTSYISGPSEVVTWDNVEPLLQLAHKYNMPVVRGYCGHFLSLHTADMCLAHPLHSPKNTLRAASLALLFLTPKEAAYGSAVQAALQKALHPIASGTDKSARETLEKLLLMVDNPDYGRLVTKEVQTAVLKAVMEGYKALQGWSKVAINP